MDLTFGNILYYLVDNSLISLESAVNGDLMVSQGSRRNVNFMVYNRNGASYFLKQVREKDGQTLRAIQTEADFYQRVHGTSNKESDSILLPDFYRFDRANSVLVIELLVDAVNIFDYFRSIGGFSLGIAAEMGNSLARFHHMPPPPHQSVGYRPVSGNGPVDSFGP
jgi:hypothetical protein